MSCRLCDGIDWVGYVDSDIREFHGYRTERGSTYNSYLIRDNKTAIIDAVKMQYSDALLEQVAALTELSKIDYVVCNHAEPDHSGGLPAVIAACPDAELICNEKCRKALSMHYNTDAWKWKIISDGESISLGERTLTFMDTPMVHWPESMFTYVPEDKLLFSMDAFGQHYASPNRFDDEEPMDIVMEEAKTYYANIVMLYGKQIAKVLDKASSLDIQMIAPSHGVIWRRNLNTIISAYSDWVQCKPQAKVLVIYDTMWKSTELMANAISEGAGASDVEVKVFNVRDSNRTKLATEVLDAASIAFGSPTLNMSLMPEMAALLTYLKGLKPAGKCGFAFGSYGWAKSAAKDVEEYMKAMKFEIIHDAIHSQFVPSPQVLDECQQAGALLAQEARKAGRER